MSSYQPHQLSRLEILPSELLLDILSYLDIPDLFALTKTSHSLRTHALHPPLHRYRLHRRTPSTLSHLLPTRPPLSHLRTLQIFLTPHDLTRRNLSRNLASVRLKHRLSPGIRPTIPALVSRGVLPARYYKSRGVDGGKGRLGGDGREIVELSVAPALVGTVGRLEREQVKDRLRRWMEGGRRPSLEEAEKWGWVELPKEEEGWRRRGVREMVRRWATGVNGREEKRWGRGRRVRYDPPRAKVLGLRRFYERLGGMVTM